METSADDAAASLSVGYSIMTCYLEREELKECGTQLMAVTGFRARQLAGGSAFRVESICGLQAGQQCALM